MFEYDQKKLYKELDGDSSGTDTNCIPGAEESKIVAIFGATSGITLLSITEMPSG